LTSNQENVSDWNDMFNRGLQDPFKPVGLVQHGHRDHFIECNLMSAYIHKEKS